MKNTNYALNQLPRGYIFTKDDKKTQLVDIRSNVEPMIFLLVFGFHANPETLRVGRKTIHVTKSPVASNLSMQIGGNQSLNHQSHHFFKLKS
jgi:hypothetical protein